MKTRALASLLPRLEFLQHIQLQAAEPQLPRMCRYGTVETAPKAELGSWMPGRHFPLRTRKMLVAFHMGLVNALSIGEYQLSAGVAPALLHAEAASQRE